MRKVFILCWHHRENKRLLMDRNIKSQDDFILWVVCDTAKVRFFKQITSGYHCRLMGNGGAHGLLHLLWDVGDDVGYLFGTHYLFLLKCLVSWFYFVSSH